MSKINEFFGCLQRHFQKRACHIVSIELSGDIVFFNILASNQTPLAKVIYDDTKGLVEIVPLSTSIKEKIANKRVRTKYTEESALKPDLQAEYLSKLVCSGQ